MALTVSTLTVISLGISIVGIGLTSYLSVQTWRQVRCCPSDAKTWRFIAALALLVAFLALLTTVTGSVAMQQGWWTTEARTFVEHLALFLRGGFLALVIALTYGWTHIERNGAV